MLLLSSYKALNDPYINQYRISNQYRTSYTVYTYTVCKGGGYGVLGLRQIKTCRKVLLHCFLQSYVSTDKTDQKLGDLHSVLLGAQVERGQSVLRLAVHLQILNYFYSKT
jgi:hypothetical protein